MASLDHRLNPLFSIKECMTCGALYTADFCCSKGGLEDKILVPKPPQNCATCGNPVDGLNCRSCAFVRKCLNEGWYTIHDENEILNTSKSSNHNTNIVSTPQEPFMISFVNDVHASIVGNGAHIGYNCPLKAPIISNPEQCNQTINELPQTLPSVHPTCNYEDENLFTYDSKPNSFNDSPSVLTHPPQLQFETYLCELCGNNAHYGYDCPPQFPLFSRIPFGVTPKVILIAWESFGKIKDALMDKQYQQEDIQELMSKLLEDVRNISEERPKAITPDEPSEEPEYPLIMEEEELSIIPEKDKSSVEDPIPIPSGSKGFSDDICDNDHFDAESLLSQDIPITSPKIDFLSKEFAGELAPIPPGMDEDEFDEEEDDCYDDDTSRDTDSFENIDYVEASPPDYELVSLEEVEDVILRDKLSNVYLLISKIEALNDNPTLSSFSYSDNSFSDHMGETRSGSTTSHVDISLFEYDSFLFEGEPDQGGLTSIVVSDNSNDPLL
ncbi:hypothetical protein Tco_0826923 [Tanacetum coccineum]